jgi:hypothetical protein
MSDFLSNLIDRSFNQTDVIQPRLLSRFERSQPSEEPAVEQFLDLETEDRALQSPSVSMSSPHLSLKPNLLSQSPTANLLSLSPPQPVIREEVVTPNPPEQAAHPIVQQHFVEQVNGSKEAPATANPQPELPVLPKGIAPRQTSPVIQPQIVSLPESVTLSGFMTKPEPPTINITIGRVDVRAIASSSQPRPSVKAPTPNLSLDDYLNARRGSRS